MNDSSSTISSLLHRKDVRSLKEVLSTFSGFEVAELLANKTEENQVFIFSLLPPNLAAETFEYLSLKTQKMILESLPSPLLASMLTEMSPDDRTALLEDLPRATVDEYIKLLPNKERTLALTLLGYPEESVGRLMTTDYIAVKMTWTIERVLEQIREYGHYSETVNVLYAIDEKDALIGEIQIQELFFAPKGSYVSQIVDYKFIALQDMDKAQEAIDLFKLHDRVALPVVDEEGILLGIVTIDDILRLSSQKNTETLQKVGGSEALDEPYMETPFFELIKKRARWLVLLFVGEMLTASAMAFFEAEIAQAVVLALFLPLIISSGGNAGSQSSTLIIRAMALDEIKTDDWWRIMKREASTGLFLGFILGIIGFLRVAIWGTASSIYGEHWFLIAATLFFSLIGVVFWGSFTGSMLPLILKKLNADPATSSAPLVATLVDVTGIVIYFLIAMLILRGSLL